METSDNEPRFLSPKSRMLKSVEVGTTIVVGAVAYVVAKVAGVSDEFAAMGIGAGAGVVAGTGVMFLRHRSDCRDAEAFLDKVKNPESGNTRLDDEVSCHGGSFGAC